MARIGMARLKLLALALAVVMAMAPLVASSFANDATTQMYGAAAGQGPGIGRFHDEAALTELHDHGAYMEPEHGPDGSIALGVAGSTPIVSDPWNGYPDPFITDHDHYDYSLHGQSTPTISSLGAIPFTGQYLALSTSIPAGELEPLDARYIAVANTGLGGFSIIDVADPYAPVVVSFTKDLEASAFTGDIKADDTGDFLFVGAQALDIQGIFVYDVSDREAPVIMQFLPVAGGCHMLSFHRDHLYCAPNDGTIVISRFDASQLLPIIPIGAYLSADPAVVALGGLSVSAQWTHDMTVQDDPLTGRATMYVSFWSDGLRVVDVENPAAPVEIGSWTGQGAPDTYKGSIHTAMAGLVNGKRIVALIPEFASIPSITILDAGDYTAMVPLSVWIPKLDNDWGDGFASMWSTHNFQLMGDQLYIAMYHGGVAVFDIAGDGTLSLQGYHIPLQEPQNGQFTPRLWDVIVHNGVMYASDLAGWVHVMHYTGDTIGDTGRTSSA